MQVEGRISWFKKNSLKLLAEGTGSRNPWREERETVEGRGDGAGVMAGEQTGTWGGRAGDGRGVDGGSLPSEPCPAASLAVRGCPSST